MGRGLLRLLRSAILLHCVKGCIDDLDLPVVPGCTSLDLHLPGGQARALRQDIVAHHLLLRKRQGAALPKVCVREGAPQGPGVARREPERGHLPASIGLLLAQAPFLQQLIQRRIHTPAPLPGRAHHAVASGALAGLLQHHFINVLFEGRKLIGPSGRIRRECRGRAGGGRASERRPRSGWRRSLVGLAGLWDVQEAITGQDLEGLLRAIGLCLLLVGRCAGGHGLGPRSLQWQLN
mmetsp:Transcript_62660/g.103335  ORF Transcript_62660/g.103335 Transcript_62660/m.103335 type:complete len:236 (+) Transcript_62660:948-1655(+)